MRIGLNPQKDKKTESGDFFHQVIIPVYIPNSEGYFKDSFTIFRICLESLFLTAHKKTFISIINNGSSNEVVQYLNQLHSEKKIHELIHTVNIGKLNAIIKGTSGQSFSFVTIADADVFFLNDWQQSSYSIFQAYPEAGAVSPVPSSKVLKHHTSNVLRKYLFSKSMKFTDVLNPNAMKHFAESIGNPNFYNKFQLEKYLCIERNGIKAVIGAGHFVATYNSEVFKNIKSSYSNYKMGSEIRNFLDKPVMDKGFWRLSTTDNYAYHMGNIFEDWMLVEKSKLKESAIQNFVANSVREVNGSKYSSFFNFIFSKLISKPKIWKKFLRFKGLTKEASNHY